MPERVYLQAKQVILSIYLQHSTIAIAAYELVSDPA